MGDIAHFPSQCGRAFEADFEGPIQEFWKQVLQNIYSCNRQWVDDKDCVVGRDGTVCRPD
jgi:hypothetical protein